jgi:hypothetical protein
MSTTLWTALFAVLMTGATVLMLAILVGLCKDSGTWWWRHGTASPATLAAASKYTELHYTLNEDSKT